MTFDHGFDFLLDQQYENLFHAVGREPIRDAQDFVCKGCETRLKRWERESHFRKHQHEQQLDAYRRQDEIRIQRIERLAKARAAKRAA